MPTPVYRAGDLVTIRLTEADAYELGCGAEAKPVVSVSAVIEHKPVPPPFTRYLNVYTTKEIYNYATLSESFNNVNKSTLGRLKVIIDQSKPFVLGEGIVIEVVQA